MTGVNLLLNVVKGKLEYHSELYKITDTLQ